jgi:hypothetical protein
MFRIRHGQLSGFITIIYGIREHTLRYYGRTRWYFGRIRW